MESVVLSAVKEMVSARMLAGADSKDILEPIEKSLKPNIKSEYYDRVVLIMANFRRIQKDYSVGLVGNQDFRVGQARFFHALQQQLDEFQDLNKLGVLSDQPFETLHDSGANLKLERVIGNRNFYTIDWLRKGDEMARWVCKIELADGMGTGFLLKGGYIMTNRHVLDSLETAKTATVLFNYRDVQYDDMELMDYQIDETGPFIIGEKSDNEADNDFDFAIFKLKDANEKDGVSIEKVRSLPKEGTQVSIIQHPQGRTMELSVDEIVSTGANDFFYKADTNAGSSGSPVFDKKWRLIALHYGYNNEQNANVGLRMDRIINYLDSEWQLRLGIQ